MGRPTKYNENIALQICDAIASSSKGLHHLCKANKDFPGFSTIMKWLSDTDKGEFQDNYARAREAQGDYMAYRSVEIAETPLLGKVIKETKDGVFTEKSDNVSRSRLMYDANVFMASKLNPKKYGNKIDHTTNGKDLPGNPPPIQVYNIGPPLAGSEDEADTAK